MNPDSRFMYNFSGSLVVGYDCEFSNNVFYPDDSLNSEMERLFGASPTTTRRLDPVPDYLNSSGETSFQDSPPTLFAQAQPQRQQLYASQPSYYCSNTSLPQMWSPIQNLWQYTPTPGIYQPSSHLLPSTSSTPRVLTSNPEINSPSWPQTCTSLRTPPEVNLPADASHHKKFPVQRELFAETGQWSRRGPRLCTFCCKNGECAEVYKSHRLRNHRGSVECPILRQYVCPLCGASGENAHTRTYCPLHKGGEADVMPLYRRMSNGEFTTMLHHK